LVLKQLISSHFADSLYHLPPFIIHIKTETPFLFQKMGLFGLLHGPAFRIDGMPTQKTSQTENKFFGVGHEMLRIITISPISWLAIPSVDYTKLRHRRVPDRPALGSGLS